jgi:uncharacterized protein
VSHESTHSTLKTFLADPARPADTLCYHELQGFLFAVSSAPELIRPSEWMPVIFADKEAGYADLDEARLVLGELMALYNAINALVFADAATLPADCAFRDDILANLDADAPISQWSRGFVLGHQWLEELWDRWVPEELEDEFAATLMVLSVFASRDIAEAFREDAGTDETLATFAAKVRELVPDAVGEYARLGRTIARVLAEESEEDRAPLRVVKTGRNDPCPCGSGRKYKRCCGAKAG